MWVIPARPIVIRRVVGACVRASGACFIHMGRLCGLCVLPDHFLAVSLVVCRLEHKMDVVNGFWLALLTFAVSQWPEAVGSQEGPWSMQSSKRWRFTK